MNPASPSEGREGRRRGGVTATRHCATVQVLVTG